MAGTDQMTGHAGVPAKLEQAEIVSRLEGVPEWSEVNGELQRTFKFGDFVEAMRFVNLVADAAEAAQHHPDVMVRYNKVTLTVSTHDAGGITELDFQLASRCDGFSAGG